MRKGEFLEGKKEWGIFFALALLVFVLGVGWKYYQFSQIPHTPFEFKAKVLAQYEKNSKTIFKLKAQNGQIFYTSSKEDLKDLSNKEVSLYGKVYDCDFLQSLKSCYFITYSLSLLPSSPFHSPFYFVQSQHSNPLISKLFESLFFASFLPKEWREIASALHISHLIAISGLHLGILAWALYMLLGKPYEFLQKRYFTYRNRLFDMGVVSGIVLFAYMLFIGTPPAFLRAYVMSVVALGFVYCHLRLLSFSFLLVCSLAIVALFPSLLLSIGFWFSISGVFYIFLFFHYFHFDSCKLQWLKIAILLNIALFLQMLPLVHYVFGAFSLFSILSIPLSVIFPLWFVVMIVLHCLGLGGVGDRVLEWALGLELEVAEIYTPTILLLFHLCISLLAMRFRSAYDLSLGVGFAFWLFLMTKILI
ncbi:ComEC/Rec2 family competence protein [Helicobacter brantae]|uniref:ComEC/Rec2-related protein domain-containing protein n=1 Tax=Helicobacter brantae TaxID=375927 RepID=A0A3D8J0F7_9HELI|nr:ComEC/Rec2 family competence protein [Helicobacter brantae]RDU70978.1 hypothetical protein CQA58_04150 [Helicobacter brantae]